MKATIAGCRGLSDSSVKIGCPSVAVVNYSHRASLFGWGAAGPGVSGVSLVIFSSMLRMLMRSISMEIVTSAMSLLPLRYFSRSSGSADLMIRPTLVSLVSWIFRCLFGESL